MVFPRPRLVQDDCCLFDVDVDDDDDVYVDLVDVDAVFTLFAFCLGQHLRH